MHRRTVLALAFAAPLALVWMACGGRTGLLTPAPPTTPDAGLEDSPVDVYAPDAVDSSDDVDATDELEQDTSFPDVPIIDLCPDAGSTLIYVITQDGDLYSFYPPTLEFRLIGTINCPQTAAVPFSMAVDRTGIGYSVFTDGTLHVVDMATAACKSTAFVPDQHGFLTFGMGYVANAGDAGETLYVAEGNVTQMPRPYSMGLASISPTSLALSYVAAFSPPILGPELTGTGSGQLFGFYTNATGTGSHIVQIDPPTGKILVDYPLVTGAPDDGYAFAFWGGVFWVFTDSAPTLTTVTRFDPKAKSEMNVTTLADGVVGAGVSTCAPQ